MITAEDSSWPVFNAYRETPDNNVNELWKPDVQRKPELFVKNGGNTYEEKTPRHKSSTFESSNTHCEMELRVPHTKRSTSVRNFDSEHDILRTLSTSSSRDSQSTTDGKVVKHGFNKVLKRMSKWKNRSKKCSLVVCAGVCTAIVVAIAL